MIWLIVCLFGKWIETTQFLDDLAPSCLSFAPFSHPAKLLAAANETKRATALVESLAKEAELIATATLLAQETKNEKMNAVEEAKILATSAVLLAATNESKYAAGISSYHHHHYHHHHHHHHHVGGGGGSVVREDRCV